MELRCDRREGKREGSGLSFFQAGLEFIIRFAFVDTRLD